MNIRRQKILLVFVLTFCIEHLSYSQGRIWFSELGVNINQEQKVEFSGSNPLIKNPAIGYFANINNGGKRIAFGIQANYSPVDMKNTNISGVKNNSLSLWEFYVVMRYYPMLPTMRIGTKVAIRFTAGGMLGGYDFYWKPSDGTSIKWSATQFSSVVFAGLIFSPFRNTTGLSVKLNYTLQTFTLQNFPLSNFTLKQPFSISAAIFIGPRIKS